MLARQDLEEASCESQNLVTNHMQPNLSWSRGIKEKGIHSLSDVIAELIPGITLCDDILAKAISNESAVLLLNNVEDNLHVFARHDKDSSQYPLARQGIAAMPQL